MKESDKKQLGERRRKIHLGVFEKNSKGSKVTRKEQKGLEENRHCVSRENLEFIRKSRAQQ